MDIYQNKLITLSYLADQDILIVTWSNWQPYSLREVQQSMDKVIETINEYKCRKLLIDASKANITMDDAAFNTSLTNFVSELGHTSIQKLARIITADIKREENIQAIKSSVSLPFKLYDISNREQAIKWLTNG